MTRLVILLSRPGVAMTGTMATEASTRSWQPLPVERSNELVAT